MFIGSCCKILVSTGVVKLNPGPSEVSDETPVGFSEIWFWLLHDDLVLALTSFALTLFI